MTVCVATIAMGGAIIGASDRMLSTAYIKYEPPWSKMYGFKGRSLVALWAGDSAVTAELLQDFSIGVVANLAPDALVSEVAAAYAECYHALLDRRITRRYLRRHGLTLDRFRAAHHKLSPNTVAWLENEINAFLLDEEVGLILAGRDRDGPHIWRVINGELSCDDMEGFAAIGTGAGAAMASLRNTGFSEKRTRNEALLLTYLAKKRGEQSPTVGLTTDMCLLYGKDSAVPLDPALIRELDAVYKGIVKREATAIRVGTKRIDAAMVSILDRSRALIQAANAESSSSATSSDSAQT